MVFAQIKGFGASCAMLCCMSYAIYSLLHVMYDILLYGSDKGMLLVAPRTTGSTCTY